MRKILTVATLARDRGRKANAPALLALEHSRDDLQCELIHVQLLVKLHGAGYDAEEQDRLLQNALAENRTEYWQIKNALHCLDQVCEDIQAKITRLENTRVKIEILRHIMAALDREMQGI